GEGGLFGPRVLPQSPVLCVRLGRPEIERRDQGAECWRGVRKGTRVARSRRAGDLRSGLGLRRGSFLSEQGHPFPASVPRPKEHFRSGPAEHQRKADEFERPSRGRRRPENRWEIKCSAVESSGQAGWEGVLTGPPKTGQLCGL